MVVLILLAVYTNPSAYLVLPLQNVIHGSVTETVDSLLSPLSPSTLSYGEGAEAAPSRIRNGVHLNRDRPTIVADLDLPIRHSLVVKRGVKMGDIRWVRSHEQVSPEITGEIRRKSRGVRWERCGKAWE